LCVCSILYVRSVTVLSHVELYILPERLPPTSPPFPYTTLFRSRVLARDRIGAVERRDRVQRRAGHHGQRRGRVLAGGRQEHGHEDRKSTRLNSSHVKISYAVFCLKKKT